MVAPVWMEVRKQLGHLPILEGRIDSAVPLYFERYLYQSIACTVDAMDIAALVTQFGGARVREGAPAHWRSASLPSQSLLIPAGVATQWHYAGTVDFAIFYLLDGDNSLSMLGAARQAPLPFSDQLVGAAALQLAGEMQKGRYVDAGYLERVAGLMLEQAFRALTTPGTGGINPRHAHFSRLQAVLNHMHAHFGEALPMPMLAGLAGISLAHFRRIFEDAMGMPPHRYLLHIRLEQARRLLASALPIARIAQECGFASQSHLTAAFRSAHAVTPAAYRASIAAHML
ncbi:MAG: AraC family transcriptional regulator [Pseudomonadota bacterium]